MVRLEMKNMQYNINREASKASSLSLGKIDKYEYITCDEILSSDKSRIIEQTKFTYSLLVKALEKQTRKLEDPAGKQKQLKTELKNKC